MDNLSKQTKSIFEIIAAHYVDIFYNHLYLLVKSEISSQEEISITDLYRTMTQRYKIGITEKHNMEKILADLHEYFKKHTRCTIISYSAFIDKILKEFIPAEFFELMRECEKDKIICSIITDVIVYMTDTVISADILVDIIDNRKLNAYPTIRKLQDYCIILMSTLRTNLYTKFITSPAQFEENDLKRQLYLAQKEIEKLKAKIADLQI